jgi:hypothetical protein
MEEACTPAKNATCGCFVSIAMLSMAVVKNQLAAVSRIGSLFPTASLMTPKEVFRWYLVLWLRSVHGASVHNNLGVMLMLFPETRLCPAPDAATIAATLTLKAGSKLGARPLYKLKYPFPAWITSLKTSTMFSWLDADVLATAGFDSNGSNIGGWSSW